VQEGFSLLETIAEEYVNTAQFGLEGAAKSDGLMIYIAL